MPAGLYLWDRHIAAIASDTFAVEAFPVDPGSVTGFLHRMIIGQFGMALGELWRTDALAVATAPGSMMSSGRIRR